MQGEQQQSREQRREEEKIKGENKRVGNNTVRTAVRLEERTGLSAGALQSRLHAGTYLSPATSSWHCTLPQGGWHNLPHCRTDVRALQVPGNSQLPATASARRNRETREATYQGTVMELFIPATHSQLPTPLPEPLVCYRLALCVARRAFTVELGLVCRAFPLPCKPSEAAGGWVGSWWMVATKRNRSVFTDSLGDSGGDENGYNTEGKYNWILEKMKGKGMCLEGAAYHSTGHQRDKYASASNSAEKPSQAQGPWVSKGETSTAKGLYWFQRCPCV